MPPKMRAARRVQVAKGKIVKFCCCYIGQMPTMLAKKRWLTDTTQPKEITSTNKLPPATQRYIGGEHLRGIYDWSRSYAHHLWAQGLIRAVLLRGPDNKRGRKLYEVESIEAFLKSCECKPGLRKATIAKRGEGEDTKKRRRGRPRKARPEELVACD
jgi:hypothetical protein